MQHRVAEQVQPQEVSSQKTLLKSIIIDHADGKEMLDPRVPIPK